MTSTEGAPASGGAKPKLIFLVTEDWYFWAHRLPQARAARDAGFDVSVATRVDKHGARIRGEGFGLHELTWRRGSVNPLGALAAVGAVVQLYRQEEPALVHHVSQKSILIGSVAARLAGVRRVVNAFTGLGFLFVSPGLKARLVRAVLIPLLRWSSARPGVRFLVENPDDRATLIARRVAEADRIVLIRGSGVDLSRFAVLPEPDSIPIVIACATRMLRIKGVGELVAAFRLLRATGSRTRLVLAGASDPENPAAIPEAELRAWGAEPGIEWLGPVEDVRELWARAHIAALSSRGGEGIPMTLMEAAACGRPMVATDVPGCREIVRDGETGLLVPPGDIAALAAALGRLAGDADLRRRCGARARTAVEQGLDSGSVGRETVAVYRTLMAP